VAYSALNALRGEIFKSVPASLNKDPWAKRLDKPSYVIEINIIIVNIVHKNN